MTIKMANNAVGRLVAPISSSGTTLVLIEADAGAFPSPDAGEWHPLTVVDGANIEIMRVTAREANVLTVVRGQEGSATHAFAAGALAEVRLTAGAIDDLQAETAAVQGNVDSLTADIAADMTTLEGQIASKASQADLTNLTSTVGTKAAQADLNTLSATVAGLATSKANQSALDSLSTTVSGLSGTVSALSSTVDGKASQSALDALSTTVAALATVPTGTVLPFAGAVAPSGFLLCAGQAVSRTTYAALWTAIGAAYGAGDGSTTFNLPDLRGRVAAGKDDMGGTAANRLTTGGSGVNGAALGTAGGAETHTLSIAQMPSHGHPYRVRSDSASSPAMTPSGLFILNSGTTGAQTAPAFNGAPSNTLGQQIGGEGGGGAHNNVQPTLVLSYMIKT